MIVMRGTAMWGQTGRSPVFSAQWREETGVRPVCPGFPSALVVIPRSVILFVGGESNDVAAHIAGTGPAFNIFIGFERCRPFFREFFPLRWLQKLDQLGDREVHPRASLCWLVRAAGIQLP